MRVIHFHNGTGGGVLSVIRNLLAYRQHPEIENHVIYTINKDQVPDYKVPGLLGATSEQVFYYSPQWNFYYTCRQLAKLLPDDKAVIVAHDWLELGMVSNLGLQNPVVQFVHGAYDYYYTLAIRHSPWIDGYIAVSKHIANELILRMPERQDKIHYFRFPVPDFNCKTYEKHPGFHCVFAGRCEDAKGYNLLPEIEKELKLSGVTVQWHIAGEGSQLKANQAVWPSDSIVQFYGKISHEELMRLFCRSHVLILPSIAEGMPVVVIEAMKAGIVPVVNDLQGGIMELIIHGVTGFRVKKNQTDVYASHIAELHAKESLRKKISNAAKDFVKARFEPSVNTCLIETQLHHWGEESNSKMSQKMYGSRLDCSFVPNFLTYLIRRLRL